MDEMPVKPIENPRRGNPNAADAALTHSYHRIAPALERGLEIIPPESPLHPAIAARREQIYSDAGGKNNLSQVRLELVEQYLATLVLISSIDGYLVRLEHPRTTKEGRQLKALGIVDRRAHKLRPIVSERSRLLEVSMKLASAIGLERKAAPVMNLQEYLRMRELESAQVACESTTASNIAPAGTDAGIQASSGDLDRC